MPLWVEWLSQTDSSIVNKVKGNFITRQNWFFFQVKSNPTMDSSTSKVAPQLFFKTDKEKQLKIFESEIIKQNSSTNLQNYFACNLCNICN